MAFENTDDLEVEEEGMAGPPPEESSNRTFLIVAGVLGGIMLLALLCTAAYAFLILPSRRESKQNQEATAIAQNTAVALGFTQTAQAKRWTATQEPTKVPTRTTAPTNTPVVVLPSNTPTELFDPVAETESALYTQLALSTMTMFPTSTALPSSGFADEVGAPGLLAIAVALVVVIFLVRRLRSAG